MSAHSRLPCLSTSRIAGGDWGGEWPGEVPTNRLYDAYARWCDKRRVSTRKLTEDSFGRQVTKLAPSFTKKHLGKRAEGDTWYVRISPGLEQLRKDFDKYIQGAIEWPE